MIFDIATAVRNVRNGKRISQEALADTLGWGQNQISRIESGKTIPSLETIGKLAIALGEDPGEFIAGAITEKYRKQTGGSGKT